MEETERERAAREAPLTTRGAPGPKPKPAKTSPDAAPGPWKPLPPIPKVTGGPWPASKRGK